MAKKRRYDRRKPYREPKKRILIITEGKRTEPRYLRAIIARLHLASVLVDITPAYAPDPISLIKTAEKIRVENVKRNKPNFDVVWLVFDTERDRLHLSEAIQMAQDRKYQLGVSTPCIEYWFVLHFKYTAKYLTSGDETVRELKKYYPKYSKDDFDTNTLIDRVPQAVNNARQLREDQVGTETECPKTDVDLLVAELNALADKANRLFDL